MQENKEANTEQFILQCAEEVFLERGFDGAKTTEIAKRAGVNHAMIHYYFRTKRNLFDMVFKSKVELFATSFSDTMTQDLPLFEKLEQAIEHHFDFLAKNPRLPFFIYSEIVNSDEYKHVFIDAVIEKMIETIHELEDALADEHAKGTIRKMKATELLMNIMAVNVTTFLAYPLLQVLVARPEDEEEIIEQRKKSNVEFVLNSLKLERMQPTYKQTSLDFGF